MSRQPAPPASPETARPATARPHGLDATASSIDSPGRLPTWLICGVPAPFPAVTGARLAAAGLALVGAIAVLVPVFPIGEEVSLGPAPPMAWLALLAVGVTGLALLRGGLRALPTGPIPLLAAGFLALHAGVSVASGSPQLRLLALTWAIWAAAFLLAAATPRRLAMAVVVAWIALAVPVALYAVYEHLARPRVLYRGDLAEEYRRLRIDVGGRRLVRAQATFGHPAPLASFLAAAMALALWAFPPPRRAVALAARAGLLLVLVAGVAATLTRGAVVALALALAAGLVARRVPSRLKLGVLAAGALVALGLAPTALGRAVVDYADDAERLARSPGRLATVRSLDDILSASPERVLLGWGGGTRDELYDAGILEASNDFEVVDNQYVTLLTEVGLLGLGLFLALVVAALLAARAAPGWWPLGLGAALLALLAALLFYEGLTWPTTALLFWSLLGFLAREADDAWRGGPA